jgi:hypothetical protein
MKAIVFVAAVFAVALSGCSGGVTTHEGSFRFARLPADDEALRNWFEEKPGVRDVRVTRQGNTVQVQYATDELRWEIADFNAAFKKLGYEGMTLSSWKSSTSFPRLVPWVPDWVVLALLIVLICVLAEGVRLFLSRKSKGVETKATDRPRE